MLSAGLTFSIWFVLVYLLGVCILLLGMRRYARALCVSGWSRSWWSLWQVAIFRLCFLLLIVSVAMLMLRPVVYVRGTERIFVEHESMLVLDVSPSIRLEWAQGSSWKYVQESALALVENMQDRKIGIVVFSGKTFLFSPLTDDADFLEQQIKNIDTYTSNQSEQLSSGTAIGDAILMATKHLMDSGVSDTSKSIILITDGDGNIGFDPQTAAQYASTKNISIYTIGIGNPWGTFYDLSHGDEQQYVTVYLDEPLLSSIAQNTDGIYVRAQDAGSIRMALGAWEKDTSGTWKQVETHQQKNTQEFWFWMASLCSAICVWLQIIYPRIQPWI